MVPGKAYKSTDLKPNMTLTTALGGADTLSVARWVLGHVWHGNLWDYV